MRPLAARTGKISTSQTVAIDAKYKKLKAEGKDVLSLGAGEPDLDTPEAAKLAAIASIQKGLTKYSAVTGLPTLREAISKKFSRDNGLNYPAAQIIVSSGAKHCVFNALLALIEEGDEVLIPSPCWTTYPELVRFLGGTPILLPTEMKHGFKLKPAQLKAAITPRSKLLILNSPVNPCGSVYSQAELEPLAQVVIDNDLYVLSDEIYEYIVYEQSKHISIAALGAEIYARTITINGMSKAYAMTGWRIGYVGAPPALSDAIAAIQSHGTHHPANASQYAALACLEADRASVETLRQHLTECRQLTLSRLAKIPELKILEPQGAFYVFFGVEAYFGKRIHGELIQNSMQICEYLLNDHLLATVPGSAFGMEGYIRISFANNLIDLGRSFERLEKGFRALLP